METKVITSQSFLDEYRQKYKPIGSQTIAPVSATPIYSTDVQSLLNRYLGDKEKLDVSTDTASIVASPQIAEEKEIEEGKSLTASSEHAADNASESDDDDDLFDDDPNNILLPTTVFSDKRCITVDEVIKKDSQLNVNHLRRHSSPNNKSIRPHMRHIKRRASSSPEGRRLMPDSDTKANRQRRSVSDINLESLHRQDSNISNASYESNISNYYLQNDLELSDADEDFDFDLEIDLNSSKHGSDSDSQKLFSLFQLDSDSQKDADSVAGYDEVDGSCAHCGPSDAKSGMTAETNTTLCVKCTSQRKERYATIKEILESELSYLKDLLLIKKHFYDVLSENELLSTTDVQTVFSNISQLIGVSQNFSDQLSDHLRQLSAEGDDYYNRAAIGQLVCDSLAMFLAFETYCINYSTASTAVDQLRKDNQLFNLFLEASQNDNAVLRRMDLKTFLMLPVQRVMKYPLLLKRLHKATHVAHSDKEAIEKANDKLTNILHHINSQSKVLSFMFSSSKDSAKPTKRTSFEIALTKLVLNTLKWKHDEIHFLNSGKLGFLHPGDSQWSDKLRTLRLNTAYGVLVTKGKRDYLPKIGSKGHLLFPQPTTVAEAAFLLVKKGNSKLQVIGDAHYLTQCLISRNTEFYDVLEITKEYVKEPYIIRPVHAHQLWFRNMKYYSMVLGGRNTRRRNALPNILLQT